MISSNGAVHRLQRLFLYSLWLSAIVFGCVCRTFGHEGPRSSERMEKLRVLVQMIRDSELGNSDPERVVSAITSLGEMKATEAIDDLIELLTYRRVWKWERKPTEPGRYTRIDSFQPVAYTAARYPATAALAQIGKPALPGLLKVIESQEENSLLSKNARYTIRLILKNDRASAQEFFKEAAAKASSPEAAKRLLKALETADEDFKSD